MPPLQSDAWFCSSLARAPISPIQYGNLQCLTELPH